MTAVFHERSYGRFIKINSTERVKVPFVLQEVSAIKEKCNSCILKTICHQEQMEPSIHPSHSYPWNQGYCIDQIRQVELFRIEIKKPLPANYL